MKKRELRGIAKAIAESERVLSNPDSTPEARKSAMHKIMELSNRFDNLEDMVAVDELVQDMLSTTS